MTNPRSAAAPLSEPRLASEAETAEYIADMLNQLCALAASQGFAELGYLLIVAREKAAQIAAA